MSAEKRARRSSMPSKRGSPSFPAIGEGGRCGAGLLLLDQVEHDQAHEGHGCPKGEWQTEIIPR